MLNLTENMRALDNYMSLFSDLLNILCECVVAVTASLLKLCRKIVLHCLVV